MPHGERLHREACVHVRGCEAKLFEHSEFNYSLMDLLNVSSCFAIHRHYHRHWHVITLEGALTCYGKQAAVICHHHKAAQYGHLTHGTMSTIHYDLLDQINHSFNSKTSSTVEHTVQRQDWYMRQQQQQQRCRSSASFH